VFSENTAPERTTIATAPPPIPAAPEPEPESFSVPRSLAPVLGIVALAIAAAVGLAALLSSSDGARPGAAQNGSSGESPTVRVVKAEDFDPYGEGGEHPDEVPLAFDGDSTTAWATETYQASLELLDKPGVGLVFDLGDAEEVAGLEVVGSAGYTFEVRAADEVGDLESDFDEIAEVEEAEGTAPVELDEPVSARYWLVWITTLPGGEGGRAEIAEVSFFAS